MHAAGERFHAQEHLAVRSGAGRRDPHLRHRLTSRAGRSRGNPAPGLVGNLLHEIPPLGRGCRGESAAPCRDRHHGEVGLRHLPPLELPGEFPCGPRRRGHEKHARHRPIQTVGHAEVARGIAGVQPVSHPGFDRRDPGGRLRGEPGRLEDGDHPRCFAEDGRRFHRSGPRKAALKHRQGTAR